jgi:exonuclease III
MDMNLGTWNVRSLYKPGAFKAVVPQLQQYKTHIAAIQETKWHGKAIMDMKTHTILHSTKEEGRHEQGVAFIADNIVKNNILDFRAINERICILRVKTRFFNVILINVHAPTKDKDSGYKEEFYQKLDKAYHHAPSNDIKIRLI